MSSGYSQYGPERDVPRKPEPSAEEKSRRLAEAIEHFNLLAANVGEDKPDRSARAVMAVGIMLALVGVTLIVLAILAHGVSVLLLGSVVSSIAAAVLTVGLASRQSR